MTPQEETGSARSSTQKWTRNAAIFGIALASAMGAYKLYTVVNEDSDAGDIVEGPYWSSTVDNMDQGVLKIGKNSVHIFQHPRQLHDAKTIVLVAPTMATVADLVEDSKSNGDSMMTTTDSASLFAEARAFQTEGYRVVVAPHCFKNHKALNSLLSIIKKSTGIRDEDIVLHGKHQAADAVLKSAIENPKVSGVILESPKRSAPEFAPGFSWVKDYKSSFPSFIVDLTTVKQDDSLNFVKALNPSTKLLIAERSKVNPLAAQLHELAASEKRWLKLFESVDDKKSVIKSWLAN